MSIFSYVCWPHKCLLLKSVCACPSPIFEWVCLFFSYKSILVLCRFWILALCQMGRLQNFFPFCWLPVHSNDCFFCCTEALEIPFVYFGFCRQFFWCFSHKSLSMPMSLMVLPRFSSRVFMVLGLMLKTLIHLELILV